MTDAIAAAPADARLVFGMRDVADEVEQTRERWDELGALDALRDRFDRILIYGHPALFNTLETYRLAPALAAKASYAGYVCAPPAELDPERFRRDHALGDAPFVLVSGGGGSDAFPMFAAALEAAELLHPRPRLVLVPGPFMAQSARAELELRAGARGDRVLVDVDIPAAMSAADALVTMGGYNTVIEALMVGRRPIVVPRATHKREQLMRAEAFERHGMVRMLTPSSLSAERLAALLEEELRDRVRLDAHEFLDPHAGKTAATLLELLEG
jgi:predicted glycosyltransferase